jgi:hypothetical protein
MELLTSLWFFFFFCRSNDNPNLGEIFVSYVDYHRMKFSPYTNLKMFVFHQYQGSGSSNIFAATALNLGRIVLSHKPNARNLFYFHCVRNREELLSYLKYQVKEA